MKYKYLLIAFILSVCANANAEWFLRGTHNAWAASQMDSAGAGTNTMQLNNVAFTSAGSIKFDRFGDWSENYGVGGLKGSNIPIAAGTWNIRFFTDTKTWSIIPVAGGAANYHIRGTFNAWAEGTLMTRIGVTDIYESCINFVGGDAAGGPRFKVDPNGGWGDAIPPADFAVSQGWVKVSFNSTTRIISVQQNLAANCGAASASSSSATTSSSSAVSSSSSVGASIYHIRGTFNSWAEGTLMARVGTSDNYESCINFLGGDAAGGPRFKVDPNGGWGDAIPAADFGVSLGWVKVLFNSTTRSISVQQNLSANCGGASSVASSSLGASIYHIRGTFNAWAEGTLMARIGTSDNYESCINFVGGDAAGGPRFKVDPNGGWGDAIPPADFGVSPGWVKVLFNSATRSISVQQNLPANCNGTSSLASSSVGASIYHIRGTFNAWAEGTFMVRIGTSDNYESCINFVSGDAAGGPRFKVDPNGGWGDAIPAADFGVSPGWVKVLFNSTTRAISVQQNLSVNCGGASSVANSSVGSSIYHIRGTFNAWAEGTLMARVGTSDNYESCINFLGGDAAGGPRFKVDPNGGWGDAIPAADFAVAQGWVKVFFNSATRSISVQQNLPANCNGGSVSSSSVGASIYHIRGTFNAWLEGTLMDRVGATDNYESCINFVGGDAAGGPRFKVDPNGGWGDAIPAADFGVSQGWVKVLFNSTTRSINVQQNLAPNCGSNSSIASSSSSALSSSSDSSSSASSVNSSSSLSSSSVVSGTAYHLRGTFNAWAEGTFMDQIGTTNMYEKCVNFVGGDAAGGPRFKIDPSGGWGDAIPPADFNVAPGWVKISFNSTTRLITAQQNMPANCGAQLFHLRGTHNAWAEGDLFQSVDNVQPVWSICRNFISGDAAGGPRFKVDPNGGWGPDVFPAADVPTSGWTSIVIDGARIVTVTKDMGPNCN